MRPPVLVDCARWPDGRVLRREVSRPIRETNHVSFVFDRAVGSRDLGVAEVILRDGAIRDTEFSTNLTAAGRRKFLWFCLNSAPRSLVSAADLPAYVLEQLHLPAEIPSWLCTLVGPGSWPGDRTRIFTEIADEVAAASSSDTGLTPPYDDLVYHLASEWRWSGSQGTRRPVRVNAPGTASWILDLEFQVAGNEYFLMFGNVQEDSGWDVLDWRTQRTIGAGDAYFFVTSGSELLVGAGRTPWDAVTSVPFFYAAGEFGAWAERETEPGELLVDVDLWLMLDELPPIWSTDPGVVESLGS